MLEEWYSIQFDEEDIGPQVKDGYVSEIIVGRRRDTKSFFGTFI